MPWFSKTPTCTTRNVPMEEDDKEFETYARELKDSTAKQIEVICKGLSLPGVKVQGKNKFDVLKESLRNYQTENEQEQRELHKCINDLEILVEKKDDEIISLKRDLKRLGQRDIGDAERGKQYKRNNPAGSEKKSTTKKISPADSPPVPPDTVEKKDDEIISLKRDLKRLGQRDIGDAERGKQYKRNNPAGSEKKSTTKKISPADSPPVPPDTVTCFIKKATDYNLNDADGSFLREVNSRLLQLNIQLKMQEESSPPTQLLLVICGVVSRLGTDVDHALQQTERRKNVILLLFHHKAPHVSLEVISERLLNGPTYASLGGMVDVVFWKENGVYDCQANQDAYKKFIDILLGMVHKHPGSTDNQMDCGTSNASNTGAKTHGSQY